jgi:hypothetical protein
VPEFIHGCIAGTTSAVGSVGLWTPVHRSGGR